MAARGGVVVAGMHLDDWDAIDEIRATVGTRVDPAKLLAGRAADRSAG